MSYLNAQTIEELQSKIDERNQNITDLEKQIKQYQNQIDSLGNEANTLSATIKTLELNRKQLETKIKVSEGQIYAKNLEIQQLGTQIGKKESNISDNQRIIKQALVTLSQTSEKTVVETILGSGSLSKAWNELDSLATVQSGVRDRIMQLNDDKAKLELNKNKSEKAKAELVALNKKLSDQKKIIISTVAEQNALLKQTNQSEASYKRLLAQKKAEQDAFERDLLELQSALNIKIMGSSLPKTGSGILAPPLAFMTITQSFGNTDFATANPQMYKGSGHPGIDLRASIGTDVRSSMSGIVSMIEDRSRNGCGYGKWVTVKHANGLSTLYAHLSLISVSAGQSVSTGDILGYSGNTGASTGPHLHYGVYATEGLVFRTFSKCNNYYVPAADFTAILNPLSYL